MLADYWRCLLAIWLLFWYVPMTDAADHVVSLPQPTSAGSISIEETLARRRSVRAFADATLSLQDISQLLWAAQGITHADGLRSAPSAGALYPLEIYLIAGRIATLPPGIYRYTPQRHQLHRTASGDRRSELVSAALHQTWIADAPAIFVFAAVFPRTAAKYGERAERYVHIETGHAAENVCLQAVALGLGTTVVGAFSDATVKRLLEAGEEDPLLLLPVGKAGR